MVFAVATHDSFSDAIGGIVFLGLCVLVGAAAVWFFRGPAQAADRYVEALAAQFASPQDGALLRNIYRTKDPKSTTVAWLLTVFLSPTVSYLYQGKWGLAAMSFITLQGFAIWWIVSIFTMPFEVLARNKRIADEAFNQIMIGRGHSSFGAGQTINVHYGPTPSAHLVSESPQRVDLAGRPVLGGGAESSTLPPS